MSHRTTVSEESSCDYCGEDIYVGQVAIEEDISIYCSRECLKYEREVEARHLRNLDDRGRQALGMDNASEARQELHREIAGW